MLLRFLFIICILIWSNAGGAEDLADTAQWRALLHYQNSKSSIDSENFFLSESGKKNPQAELLASIKLFEGDDDEKKCLFPARYLWLKKQGMIKKDFPYCKEYEQFRQDLQPDGVTLLFTDAYMNNPSSMFGHTLLRIDTKRKGTQLLAHGANYGAFTGDEPGALYAVLGLTGGYFGGFTVKPYYDIINTYNNIENRDIWELNLDFDDEELEFFVAHLWEIGQTQSRYYFFSRNCSYMLMEMIDAVRPELKLAEQFPVHAIPLDTFKAAYRAKGLTKGINYRPSRQNKIRYRYKMMDDEQKNAYLQIIKTKKFELPQNMDEAKKADVLETAYQYVQYQYVAKDLELKEYRRQSFDALRLRSKLTEKGSIEDLKEGKSPLLAHESMRAVVGGGVRNGESFEEIAYRPAYQSLTDNTFGLPKGAEINFLETSFRHYDEQDKTVLHNFDLLTIRSISPIDEMFRPISFQIKANVERWQNPKNEREGYIGNLVVGTGGAYALGENIWGFVLINTKGAYGGFLPHNSWLAMSADVGILVDFDRWKILGEVEPQWASQKVGTEIVYKLEANYILDTNWSIGAKVLFKAREGKDEEEFGGGLRYYF